MKMKNIFLYMTLLVLALVIVAGFAGCGQQAATGDEAQQMDSDLNEVDALNQDLGSLDAELNDSAIADIEDLL